MAFLASDALQGREPGTENREPRTEGFDVMADYVAAEFQKLGLSPGGVDHSFFKLSHFAVRTEMPTRYSWMNLILTVLYCRSKSLLITSF